jgi:large subunit ribosomal protein L13e
MNKIYNQRPVVKTNTKFREGKGFSIAELKEAGLTILDAKRIGIYLDKRRKSCHSQNVQYLKSIELKKKS